jgi:hypothetical protein
MSLPDITHICIFTLFCVDDSSTDPYGRYGPAKLDLYVGILVGPAELVLYVGM